MDPQATLTWSQLMTQLEPLLLQGPTKLDQNKPHLLKLLETYNSREPDFGAFCFFDDKGYTKNLVKAYANTCNVIVMCWSANQSSLFHGHEGSRCFVKVLKGELLELQVPHPAYKEWEQNMAFQATEKVLKKDDVSYIDDNIGVHKMINQSEQPAVTLHIYLPAYEHCRIFEQASQPDGLRMDKSRCIDVTFFSPTRQLHT